MSAHVTSCVMFPIRCDADTCRVSTESIILYRHLTAARDCLITETDLHMLYHITPVEHEAHINWGVLQQVREGEAALPGKAVHVHRVHVM